MRTIAEFMIAPCETVDALTGLRQIKGLFFAHRQPCFPVVNGGRIVGVMTWQTLIQSHPNRIAADAMSERFAFVESRTTFWQAAERLTQSNLAALLVKDNDTLVGLVTPEVAKLEMGRHTDLLTGLYKTDYFYYRALHFLSSGREMSIIFIDINNFGLINKRYGHIKGDLILKELSAILKERTPSQACLCRFGGDEFVLLLPVSREEATVLSRKLLGTIAGHSFAYNIPVTVSAGIATAGKNDDAAPEPGKALAALLNMASLASTAAKQDKSGIKLVEPSGVSIGEAMS